MSFSEETFYTILKRGLKQKDGTIIRGDKFVREWYPPSQNSDFSVSFTPFFTLGSRQEVYNNAYSQIIYEPPEIVTSDPDPNFVPNVAKVRFYKAANSSQYAIQMLDANDNVLSDEPGNIPSGRPGEVIDPDSGNWVPDPGQIVSCCLICLFNDGDPYKCGWGLVEPITQDAKSYGPGTGNPGQDVIKKWEFFGNVASDANFEANLDAWCYGEYWDPGSNAGKPDGNPDGSDGGDGMGSWPIHSMQVPGLPSKSAASAGFMRIYNITESELNDLASELWDPSFWNTIVKNFTSPFENIISLGLIPYAGFLGTTEPVQIGNYQSQVQADALSNTYYEIDCGNVVFHRDWGLSNFLDFEPHLKMHVVLPYAGGLDVSPSEFMYKTMNIKCHFDVFTGSCVYFISSIDDDGNILILYQKEGNIKTEIPINGANYTQVYNAAIGAVFSLATAGIGAGAAGLAKNSTKAALGVAGAAAGGAHAISSAATIKPSYQRAGQMGATHGLMGFQRPYVVVTIPKSVEAPEYKSIHGYPSGKRIRIGDASGFLSSDVDFNDLQGIPCTDEEREMIKAGLAQGIYC